MLHGFGQDIKNVAQIPVVENMLDVICRLTGMGFAAIARVTDETWLACYVRDDISFGLKPGGELMLETTICNEIRESRTPVVIDHVNEDPAFKCHHTPAMYGFQSYISYPIIRRDGSFFGTLCAIDPAPKKLKNPAIMGMFSLFADLISFHLHAVEQLEASAQSLRQERDFNIRLEQKIKERTLELELKNEMLIRSNKELQSFNYVSSHDLQEPLRKIQTFVSRIEMKEMNTLSPDGVDMFGRLKIAAGRMQNLIDDLVAYSHADLSERNFEHSDLNQILDEVKEDLADRLKEKNAVIEAPELGQAYIIPFQFKQLLNNLIGNSIKYTSPGKPPHIKIEAKIVNRDEVPADKVYSSDKFCHIRLSDNGIGFSQEYSQRIFELFQRLHDRSRYDGTGIGLAIVRKIVENHDGFISAKGEEGVGAEFNIFIPGNRNFGFAGF